MAPVTVRIEIEDLDTGRAVAHPFRVVVNEGDKVLWNFDEIDAERYRPEVVWVSFRRDELDLPSDPRPAFGQLKASGNQVVSDGCRSGFEGLHGYEARLVPLQGVDPTTVRLEFNGRRPAADRTVLRPDPVPPEKQLGRPRLGKSIPRPDPPPPEIKVEGPRS